MRRGFFCERPREIIGVKGHEEGCNYTQSNVVFSQKGKMKDELYKIYL
jgi:hypothetical protein